MVRVFVADDHAIVRDGVRLALEARDGRFLVVGEAADGLLAVSMCERLQPDVAVLDVRMPVLDGLSAARQVLALGTPPRVVILTGDASGADVQEAMTAGVSACVLKTDLTRDLVDAVRIAAAGGTYVSPRAAGRVAGALGETPEGRSPVAKLSRREVQVLTLIAEGGSTKEIAAKLGVSVKTVEAQRKQVMGKLRIDSVAGLTKYAVRAGLVVP